MNLSGINKKIGIKKNHVGLTTIFFSLISIIFLTPILLILISLFDGYSSTWNHLLETVLSEYVANSLLLVLGVSFGVFILGVSTAWLITSCNFMRNY